MAVVRCQFFAEFFPKKFLGTFKLSTRNLDRLNYFNVGSIADNLKPTEQNLGRVFNSRFVQTGLTNPSVNKIKMTKLKVEKSAKTTHH